MGIAPASFAMGPHVDELKSSPQASSADFDDEKLSSHGHSYLIAFRPTTDPLSDIEDIALPDFDDPNIDKPAAIAGVLGIVSALYLASMLTHCRG